MTLKCNASLKSDGHAKDRWFALNPDGLARQSPMVQVESPKPDGVTRQSPMTLIRLIKHIYCFRVHMVRLYASRKTVLEVPSN